MQQHCVSGFHESMRSRRKRLFALILWESVKDMEILLVTATAGEASWLKEKTGIAAGQAEGYPVGADQIRILHTGIGMVNTAWALANAFGVRRPDLVVNFGIAGAFEGGPEIGEVVEMVEDSYAELGAESPAGFLDLETMGFENFVADGQVWYNTLRNPRPGGYGLRICKGITVNMVHGVKESIAVARERWSPEVESMEGAAFFQACLMAGIPFQAYRGISNTVEPRNRANWKIKVAAEAVQAFILQHFFKTRV